MSAGLQNKRGGGSGRPPATPKPCGHMNTTMMVNEGCPEHGDIMNGQRVVRGHTYAQQILPAAPVTPTQGDERARASRDENDNAENEDEMIVLDPKHPLMKRVHMALKEQLTKQLEELDLKLREKAMEEQAGKAKREELGVRLYNVQQELARDQAYLKTLHEKEAEVIKERRQAQEELEKVREQYNNTVAEVKKEQKQVSQLQSEVENVARHLLYMQKAATDMRLDMAVMKNAKNKAQVEKRQAEEHKLQQDLYVERLMKQEEKLREQINLYDVQMLKQTSEKQAVGETLDEAQLELDSIILENKQLLQQWNSSLLELKRREEAYTKMQETLRSGNDEVRALDTELEGYRHTITLEQEKNESLAIRLKRAEHKRDTYTNLLEKIRTQQEALQSLYTTNTHTLQETEKSLNRVTTECNTQQTKLTVLRKQIENEAGVRVELEEKIMRNMQKQLTHNSTAKHIHCLSTNTMALYRQRYFQLSKVECDLAVVELEVNEVAQRVEALTCLQQELKQEVTQQNQLFLAKESTIAKNIITIERNQATINTYNKKIEQLRTCTGQEDLGPLEIEVRAVNKQLEELGAELKEKEQFWLRQQGELVRMSQEKQAQSDALVNLKTELTIWQQRILRTKNEIEQEERGLVDLERSCKVLRLDIQKLNTLLNQNTQLKQELEQSNSLMENNFIHTLKDAERESVKTQLHVEMLQKEKEQLLNSLVEVERHIMLWERKIQLAREIRSTVDSDIGKGEIQTMMSEIHRMEVYYNQLMKKQKSMVKEMEAAVTRNEGIFMRSAAQADSSHRHTIYNLQNTLQNLRRSILQKHKQAEENDRVIAELQQENSALDESLREKERQIGDLNNSISAHIDDISNMEEIKERNRIQLLALQSQVKQLQAVKEDRYRPTARGEDELQRSMQAHQEWLQSMSDVLQGIIQDLPQHKPVLSRILLFISAHTIAGLE